MAYIRRHRNKWQSVVRITGHPIIAKSFTSKTDAKLWALSIESKIRRDDLGILKIKFPTFSDIATKYIKEVSPFKKSFVKERYIILALMNESWSKDPINKITPLIIGRYRDKYLLKVSGSSVSRSLDVISTIFTTCRKEWGYPIENPVLSIRRPKKKNHETEDFLMTS